MRRSRLLSSGAPTRLSSSCAAAGSLSGFEQSVDEALGGERR